MSILKYVAHSKKAISIASEFGWLPAARYTNLRDIKTFDFHSIGFLDIDWKNYNFEKHLQTAKTSKPKITIARDLECITELESVLSEAEQLSKHCKHVVIVPKDVKLNGKLGKLIPKKYLLGYSVPSKYGKTTVSIDSFDRPVHLLGGRPDVQRKLADCLKVFSIDCNRFTFDAKFGDYFDGETFRPHKLGGYERCLKESVRNINKLWDDYIPHRDAASILEL